MLSTTGAPYPEFLSRPTSSMSNFDTGIKCAGRLLRDNNDLHSHNDNAITRRRFLPGKDANLESRPSASPFGALRKTGAIPLSRAFNDETVIQVALIKAIPSSSRGGVSSAVSTCYL